MERAGGRQALSFTMLTVKADDHPLMKRFHRPGDEKRSVVIVPRDEYESWLSCRSMDEALIALKTQADGRQETLPSY